VLLGNPSVPANPSLVSAMRTPMCIEQMNWVPFVADGAAYQLPPRCSGRRRRAQDAPQPGDVARMAVGRVARPPGPPVHAMPGMETPGAPSSRCRIHHRPGLHPPGAQPAAAKGRDGPWRPAACRGRGRLALPSAELACASPLPAELY
jgi:hypothetical protein